MLVFTLALMTLKFAMVYPLYGVKAPALVTPTQAQQTIPLAEAAPASVT